MNLEDANKQLPKLDKLLTGLGDIGKKHWGKLIVIGLLVVLGWFCMMVAEEVENDYEEEYYEQYDE